MRASAARLALFAGWLAAAATAAAPAMAGVTATQIGAVAAAPDANATLPLDLTFRDDEGRPLTLGDAFGRSPAVVVFADYTCRTLCGPVLEFAAAGLAKTGLKPGTDFRLVVIGIDPRDGLGAARTMRHKHIASGSPLDRATTVLSGGEAEIRAATHAVGLRYDYDPEHDQFAHPAAIYVVGQAGRVQRVLSPLGLDGSDLRLAIVDTGGGAVGTLADRIHLLCYGYDPVSGVYTERITMLLEIAAGATLLAMALAIGAMLARERRSVPP